MKIIRVGNYEILNLGMFHIWDKDILEIALLGQRHFGQRHFSQRYFGQKFLAKFTV